MKDVVFEPADWKDRVRPASECDVDHGSGELISRDELMPPLPSPFIDRTRACIQSTAIGQALVWPLIKWWRKRSRPQLQPSINMKNLKAESVAAHREPTSP